jgi:hypothetical protein
MKLPGRSYLVASVLSQGHIPDDGQPPQTGTYDIVSGHKIFCSLLRTIILDMNYTCNMLILWACRTRKQRAGHVWEGRSTWLYNIFGTSSVQLYDIFCYDHIVVTEL